MKGNRVDNIKVTNMEYKASTLGDNVTSVDKEWTFGKREYLTVDGKFDAGMMKPTEERMILQNADKSIIVTVSYAYNDSYVGENMLGYFSNEGFDGVDENLANNNTVAMLSYNNIIVTVSQVAKEKYDIDIMSNTLSQVVNNMKAYEKSLGSR